MINYMNKWIRIEYNDGRVICQGQCLYQKIKTLHLISVDNKYFFHTANSKKYKVVEVGECQRIDYKPFESELVEIRFTKAVGMVSKGQCDLNGILEYDVFVENSEKELDKEVVGIVYALNLIEGIHTTGSCSGHFIRKPWVNIEFLDMNALTLLNIIVNRSEFCDIFRLSNNPNVKLIPHAHPQMTLYCNLRVPFANRHLNRLARYIENRYE